VTKFVYAIESLSNWVGRNKPTVWAFDMMIQMYGALFLMAGAYALAQDSHVRGDVVYRLFPVRMQGFIDFILYLAFFFPGVIALAWYGAEIASDSWGYKEVSWNSPARIQIYFFKTLIPIAGSLLILQQCRSQPLTLRSNKYLSLYCQPFLFTE